MVFMILRCNASTIPDVKIDESESSIHDFEVYCIYGCRCNVCLDSHIGDNLLREYAIKTPNEISGTKSIMINILYNHPHTKHHRNCLTKNHITTNYRKKLKLIH